MKYTNGIAEAPHYNILSAYFVFAFFSTLLAGLTIGPWWIGPIVAFAILFVVILGFATGTANKWKSPFLPFQWVPFGHYRVYRTLSGEHLAMIPSGFRQVGSPKVEGPWSAGYIIPLHDLEVTSHNLECGPKAPTGGRVKFVASEDWSRVINFLFDNDCFAGNKVDFGRLREILTKAYLESEELDPVNLFGFEVHRVYNR